MHSEFCLLKQGKLAVILEINVPGSIHLMFKINIFFPESPSAGENYVFRCEH